MRSEVEFVMCDLDEVAAGVAMLVNKKIVDEGCGTLLYQKIGDIAKILKSVGDAP